jgi:hypothetical protein
MGVVWDRDKGFSKKSYVLTCKPLKESATYSVIAAEIFYAMTLYGIEQKTIRVITDGGSNYIKAFKSVFPFYL